MRERERDVGMPIQWKWHVVRRETQGLWRHKGFVFGAESTLDFYGGASFRDQASAFVQHWRFLGKRLLAADASDLLISGL